MVYPYSTEYFDSDGLVHNGESGSVGTSNPDTRTLLLLGYFLAPPIFVSIQYGPVPMIC